jgi:hypothetical protein
MSCAQKSTRFSGPAVHEKGRNGVRRVTGPAGAVPVVSPVAFRSLAWRFFFSGAWLRHARFGKPRSAAAPLGPFLRRTGLPSRSALVAPPLRLAALRWRVAFLREAPRTDSPYRACGSRAPLQELRSAFARMATGGCPASVPRAPGVGRRRQARRGASSRAPCGMRFLGCGRYEKWRSEATNAPRDHGTHLRAEAVRIVLPQFQGR